MSVRIGTWNVEYAWPKRVNALRDVIAAHPADIWVLTETHDDLAPPGLDYALHSKPRPKNWRGIRDGSRWVSIWSRYPIIENATLPDADQERTVAGRMQIGERVLLVYGTVLPWKGDVRFDFSEQDRVIPLQCDEWRRLADRYPNDAMCVAGDYNTDMNTGSVYGTGRGIDALNAGLADCDMACVTGGKSAQHLLPYLIDHIALPRAWATSAVIAAAWPADKKNLSDHAGLVVECSPG